MCPNICDANFPALSGFEALCPTSARCLKTFFFGVDLQSIQEDPSVGGVPGKSARSAHYQHLYNHPDFRQGATGHVNAAEHHRNATMSAFPYSPHAKRMEIFPRAATPRRWPLRGRTKAQWITSWASSTCTDQRRSESRHYAPIFPPTLSLHFVLA
jgi:hypothetical protein